MLQRIPRLLADLDDDEFTVREKASTELAKLGELALPALQKALAAEPSPEVRFRVEALLDKLVHADAGTIAGAACGDGAGADRQPGSEATAGDIEQGSRRSLADRRSPCGQEENEAVNTESVGSP